MRIFSVLSDIEFEELVADVLATELSTTVERFAAGPDGGIDLRWKTAKGGLGIGQCKHYLRSTFSQLIASARDEARRLRDLKPSDYFFVTSFDLSVGQKDKLYACFRSWMAGPENIIGGRDLDGLLTRNENVERRHPKLWLSTGSQLFWSLHSSIASRTSALRDRIEKFLPLYVVNRGYDRARALLESHRVCVIAGVPGIGKTMLAYVLLADAMALGYEPVEVSADIEEAWTALDVSKPQVFLYDDFLGQLSFAERLGKNEDKRLSDLVTKVDSTRAKLLIMTTREYILQDARQSYERLNELDQRMHFVLALEDYTRNHRARILYNHLWHSDVSMNALQEVASGRYKEIIDHDAYSPRLIEYCTGKAFDTVTEGYVGRVVYVLDHPSQLWRTAFERHLTVLQQLVVVTLATLPTLTALDDLQSAHEAVCDELSVTCTGALFRSALSTMEGTFVEIERVGDTPSVEFQNPSIREFALDWLADDHRTVAALIKSAVFFEQLRELYSRAVETTTLHGGALSRPNLRVGLDRLKQEFVSGIARTIDGPSSDRRSEWDQRDGRVYRPQPSWFEDRLYFCLDLPDGWRPDGVWLTQQLGTLSNRWREGLGGKAEGVRLMRQLSYATVDSRDWDDEISTLEDAVKQAGAELDEWLSSTLEETEEDWVPYLERLEEDHYWDLSSASDLATRFEEFARDELDRWDPSPPNLDVLLGYARKFGSSGLVTILEKKTEEVSELDYETAAKLKPSKPEPASLASDDSDDTLDQMFRRLVKTP